MGSKAFADFGPVGVIEIRNEGVVGKYLEHAHEFDSWIHDHPGRLRNGCGSYQLNRAFSCATPYEGSGKD